MTMLPNSASVAIINGLHVRPPAMENPNHRAHSIIAYMRAILTRGAGSYNAAKLIFSSSLKEFAIVVDSVKTPVLDIHSYRTEFTYNSEMILDNMFRSI